MAFRNNKITANFVTGILLLFPLAAFGQTVDEKGQEATVILNPLVITPNRWEEPFGEVTDRITVVDELELKLTPARDAAEALESIPGVILDRTGGPGSVVFPSIQGSDYYQTTVLINGIPLNDLANGLGNLGQIPAEQIERIEVIHGAGGVEWGSALGGVINVITHKANRRKKSHLVAGVGDYATRFGSTTLRYSKDNVALAIGGGLRKGNGSEGNKRSDSKQNALANLEITLGEKTHLYLLAYGFQGSTESGEFRSDLKGYWEKYKYRTSGTGLKINTPVGRGEISLTGYLQKQNQNNIQYIGDTGQVGDDRLEDLIYGASLIGRTNLGAYTLTFGADAKNGQLKSSGLKKDTYHLISNGAFANFNRKLGDTVVQLGVRQNQESEFGSFTGFNTGFVYRKTGLPIEFRATASRGYTAPPLAFKYVESTGYFIPNPDLTNEKVMAYQVGVKAKLGHGLKADLNVFQANVEDAISKATNNAGLSYFKNFKKFRRRGLESELKWTSKLGMWLFANTLLQEIKDTSLNEIVKDKVRAAYSIGTGYLTGKWRALLFGTYRNWNASDKNAVKDKEWLWNTKLTYKHRLKKRSRLEAFVSIFNITNTELATNQYVPLTPPRQIEVGLVLEF